MLADVPQYSTLSPILYNLYTSAASKLALCADDTCIYDNNHTGYAHLAVQRHLKEIEWRTTQLRINIITNKTKIVVFS